MKHLDHPSGRIDVYPVGVLADLIRLRRALTHTNLPPVARQYAWRRLRGTVRHLWERARAGKWREVKNTFNGYLAEPTPFPDHMRRCGSGWTKRRALRSLYRSGYRP